LAISYASTRGLSHTTPIAITAGAAQRYFETGHFFLQFSSFGQLLYPESEVSDISRPKVRFGCSLFCCIREVEYVYKMYEFTNIGFDTERQSVHMIYSITENSKIN